MEQHKNNNNCNDGDESKRIEGKKMRRMLYAINKPNRATIVNRTKAQAFIDTIVKNRATKTYWDECSSTSRNLDPSILDDLIRKSREK